MSQEDVIRIGVGQGIPPDEPSSVPGYVKHVQCDGARHHVLSYDSGGRRCSVPDCVINSKRKENCQNTTLSLPS